MFNLGAMHESGRGGPQDYNLAKYWYEKASSIGSARAMTKLGFIYITGQGVSKDPAKAKILLREQLF